MLVIRFNVIKSTPVLSTRPRFIFVINLHVHVERQGFSKERGSEEEGRVLLISRALSYLRNVLIIGVRSFASPFELEFHLPFLRYF